MAPRRGGGGGGSGSGGISVSCPSPFQHSVLGWATIALFVLACLFFVFFLILLFSICCVRKSHGNGKRLVGAFFILSAFCNLIGHVLDMIGTILKECETTEYYTYYDWRITFLIFFNIANYLLLVIFVYSLNMLLRSRLGSAQSIYKVICLSILGIMGALTCALIGLLSYNNWTFTPEGQNSGANIGGKGKEASRFGLAYWILYMLAVLASGVLSITSIISMRNRRIPTGNLFGRTAALFFCMFFWAILQVVGWSANPYNSSLELSLNTQVAFSYLITFFQLFSYIAILVLSRSAAWDSVAPAPDTTTMMYPPQPGPQKPGFGGQVQQPQQYAYGPQQQPGQQYVYGPQQQPGQQYYYQPQPVYNGGLAPAPVNGSGPMAEVKG